MQLGLKKMSNPTAFGLVQWCQSRLGQGYIYAGYFDRIITEAYIQQKARDYPERYTDEYIQLSRKWIGQEAGDCVGLIKSYYWFNGTKVIYGYKGRADRSADGMLSLATVKGKISTMPDIPGLFVHYSGHIGVYIGNGYVIESRGVRYGVVKTKLSDRPWTSWGQVPYVDYGEGEQDMFAIRGQGSISKPDMAVMSIQNAFIKLNIEMKNDKGEVFKKADGSYGGATANGVKLFEVKHGLTVSDGNSFTNVHLIVLINKLTALSNQSDCSDLELEVDGLSLELKNCRNELSASKSELSKANAKISDIKVAINVFKNF